MKPAMNKWTENRWPLIEKNITRADCLKWMLTHGFEEPPRSACSFCPYHSDEEWERLKQHEPEAFAEAVKFDHDFRTLAGQVNTRREMPYLHESLKPLSEVDFPAWARTKKKRTKKATQHLLALGQFGNECEGMCGV